ncbi:radical SAM protein [Candidatus Bathyarchaeota archaeon]|nr:radical SAM protein [Candidatus Bathyarchaeota archaeon]
MSLKKIRVSLGSAIVLGLTEGMISAEPTTAYLLTYRRGRCLANCAFCPQARFSSGRTDMLSRVTWPAFNLNDVVKGIERAADDGRVKRVCIQALNYPGVQDDIAYISAYIRSASDVPISVSCQPLKYEEMIKLREAGVERVSVSLDAATEEIFTKIKGELATGPYKWQTHLDALKNAVKVFGKMKATTHLIVGLGEREEDIAYIMQRCVDMGVFPALFAFTPVPGTRMVNHPRPPVAYYRRVQIAHYLITHGIRRFEDMKFESGYIFDFGISTNDLHSIVLSGEPFLTSGCPGCNRPYYNEDPRGPIYNYPRKPAAEEILEIEKQMGLRKNDGR